LDGLSGSMAISHSHLFILRSWFYATASSRPDSSAAHGFFIGGLIATCLAAEQAPSLSVLKGNYFSVFTFGLVPDAGFHPLVEINIYTVRGDWYGCRIIALFTITCWGFLQYYWCGLSFQAL